MPSRLFHGQSMKQEGKMEGWMDRKELVSAVEPRTSSRFSLQQIPTYHTQSCLVSQPLPLSLSLGHNNNVRESFSFLPGRLTAHFCSSSPLLISLHSCLGFPSPIPELSLVAQ